MSAESWGASLAENRDSAPLPPQDLDAERALLGAMLINPGAIAVARGHASSGDFYRVSHGTVFAIVLEMNVRGEPVDFITLAAELRRRGLLIEVGGEDFIHALPGLCPVAVNVAQYAAVVREQALRREGIALSRRLEQAFAEGTASEQVAAGRKLLRLLDPSSREGSCGGVGPRACSEHTGAGAPLAAGVTPP